MNKNAAIKATLMDDLKKTDSGCWVFGGSKRKDGYGYLTWDGVRWLAHRVSYVLHVGPIPEGKVIDHLCRNTSCINPKHLDPKTIAENVLCGFNCFADNAKKTHCKNGHPLGGSNLIVNKNGSRTCRTCKHAWFKQHRKKNPALFAKYESRRDRVNRILPERRKTHCHNGHPLSGDNLLVYKGGDRKCKACRQQYMKEYFQKRKLVNVINHPSRRT